MEEINALREEIENIDKDIASLLEKRLDIATLIGKIKKEKGLAIFDPKREEQLKQKNINYIKEEYKKYYLEVLEIILKVSKENQL